MSRRARKTRTITFRGGPDDGIVGQHPHGYEEIRANTIVDAAGRSVGWDEYVGPGGAGAAEFRFTRHVGVEPNDEGTPTLITSSNVYIAPVGSEPPTVLDLGEATVDLTRLDGWVDLGYVTDDGILEAEPRSSFNGVGTAIDTGPAVAAAVCDRCRQPTSAPAAVGRPHLVCGGTFRAVAS